MSHLVDIIIRAKDGPALTYPLIDSITANTDPSLFNIILVDDGSDPAYDAIEDITHIRHSTAKGAVSATNSGIAQALLNDAPYIMIMDNDTQVPDGDAGWLERFIAELEGGGDKCAAVGATSSFVNVPQHILQCPKTYSADWQNDDGTGGNKLNPAVPWFVSFCVLLKKSAVREVGMWDEQYNPGNYEDTDYAMQLRVAGYEVKVARSVYIHHKGHKTFGDKLQQLLATNQIKFYEKWGIGRLPDMAMISENVIAGMLARKAKANEVA